MVRLSGRFNVAGRSVPLKGEYCNIPDLNLVLDECLISASRPWQGPLYKLKVEYCNIPDPICLPFLRVFSLFHIKGKYHNITDLVLEECLISSLSSLPSLARLNM